MTNGLKTIYNFFINQIKNYINNTLSSIYKYRENIIDVSNLSYHLLLSDNYNYYSTFKILIIGDNVISAYYFIKDFIFLKLISDTGNLKIEELDNNSIKNNENRIKIIGQYKKKIIDNYNNIYKLSTIERYLFYFILSNIVIFIKHSLNFIFSYIIDKKSDIIFQFICCILNLCVFCIIVPKVQNKLYIYNKIDNYRNNLINQVNIFIKYYFSKKLIIFIKNLNNNINEIRTYNIFIVYNYLTFDFILNFAKSYCFIAFLYYFRNSKETYYYYKIIKLACYYNYGLDFNIMTKEQSIDIINELIFYKKWKDLRDFKNTHAIYVLIYNKYFTNIDYYDKYINLLIFISVWNFISLLNILSIKLNILIITIVSLYRYKYNYKNINKNILFIAIEIICRIVNLNELTWAILTVCNDTIYEFIKEIVFYTRNKKSFNKAINYYSVTNLKNKQRERYQRENKYSERNTDYNLSSIF